MSRPCGIGKLKRSAFARPLIFLVASLLLLTGAPAAHDAAATSTAATATNSVTFAPVADAYTLQPSPSDNYGAGGALWADASPLSNAYLRFDASSVGAISSAKLRLYVSNGTVDGPLVYETESAWSESTLTWNTNPATKGAALANLGAVAAGGWVEIDVSSVLTSGREISFGLVPENDDAIGVDSRESAYPAQLLVTTTAGDTTPPTAPSGLAVTTGQTSATLSWNASSDDVGVSGYRLFLNGSRVATTPQLTYSFTGLACGTSYTLGVAAYDAAGNESTVSSVSAATAPCPSGTIVLSPVADAYTLQASPTGNYGAGGALWADATPLSNAYLRFDASSVGAISSAKLRLYVSNGTVDGPVVYETDSGWSESTLTWNTNPATRGAALANLGAVAAGGWVEIDVSSVLTSGREISFGLLPESDDAMGVDSRESAYAAQLVLATAAVVAPVNTAAPTISGSPVVGQTLTATSGGWSGSPTSYGYQWYRCDANGAACAAVSGANVSSYVVGSADVGSTLRVAVTASNLAGSATATSPPTAVVTSVSDPVVVAAGDICDSTGACSKTAALIAQVKPTHVLTIGDNAYPDGTLSNYMSYYEPYWGQFKAITSPAPGNHDYHVAGGADYFTYFGNPPAYYSFDLGSWHLVSLDGEIATSSGSAQETWFRNDLAAHTNKCTLVYWHEPRFSSGAEHGNDPSKQALWQDAYNGGVEIVLSGHDHEYERFAPMNGGGALDVANGVREFVVGTGGAPLYSFGTIQPNSEVRNAVTWGVLELTLHPDAFDWEFVPVAGETFTDTGSESCH